MERTRIGFIGAGIIANRHLGNLLGFPEVEVVALADLDLARAREAAGRCGARAYDDFGRMLDAEALDALYICVPPFAHGAPEAAAIERGLPFFVEKPLAVDLATAETIARGVAERGLITAAGYHWRYLDIVEEVRERLANNPARLALGYWLDFTPPPDWWTREELSGGQMVEQTTHIFDLARYLVGEVESVYAVGGRLARPAYPEADIDDTTGATLRFASGAIGQLASTCLLNWPHRIGLHLFSEGMAIELTEFELMVDIGKGRPVRKAQGDPFVREDRDFIDAVRGGPNRIRAPYAEALATHRIVTAAARSAREGRPLAVVDGGASIVDRR
jgi:predicted dehydrogenase